jgi:hypothetical protein
LRSGQKVLCHDSISKGLRYAEILDVRVENGTAKWVDVVLEDGTNLQMTANHPVLPVAGSQQGSDGTGAVRALDLCPGSDYLMVLKTMPVLVQGIELGTSDESEERVFLTLHQPQRHSLFVASAPGESASSPTVQTIAVGSADARPQYDIAAKNTFIDMPTDTMCMMKRSNSAPPDYREAKYVPTISSSYNSSLNSTLSDSSISPPSDEVNILVAPDARPVLDMRADAGGANLKIEDRSGTAVALSEVLGIQSMALRSLGSIDHASGQCRTCLFANRADHTGGSACWKGVFCERCHETHAPMSRRKPKTGRQRERSRLVLL